MRQLCDATVTESQVLNVQCGAMSGKTAPITDWDEAFLSELFD